MMDRGGHHMMDGVHYMMDRAHYMIDRVHHMMNRIYYAMFFFGKAKVVFTAVVQNQAAVVP